MNDFVTISLTQGYQAMIDEVDLENVSRYKWYIMRTQKNKLYAYTKIDEETVLMHRFIADASRGQIIHHKNGNGLDNRRSNLQETTYGGNARDVNKALSSQNVSGCPGVSQDKRTGKWKSRIKVDYKEIFLGTFFTKKRAIEARLKAEAKYWNTTVGTQK